ncbi:larval cuticle protein LCP-22-like isoform X2 [Pectinophora gossypiella]|uniref:larval cuticle protein LCP-22-like isoform X2 n=1 Tax=Pectinophora gossypiella TaxID=13191 RepID=UPI00214EE43C|nr:larval cuticle protein LCP-22-like isoform X2 [Pectinophora gossypiella]
MKFAVVVLACVVAAASAQFNRASAFSSFGSFPKPQQPFRSQPVRPAVYKPAPAVVVSQPAPVPVTRYNGDARSTNIVKYGNEVNPDGSYSYFYETDNGIAAQEQGTPRNFGGNPPVIPDVAQGSFSWTSPEGVPVAITYVADENGYQPQGAAIPTPPPVPAQIARALDYIARNAPRQ